MPATLKTTNIQEPSSSTVNMTLPASGGGVTINGTTSGGVTVKTPAVAGSNTFTVPAATGTAIVSTTAIGAVSGTPSSSNYLRGDATWSTISSSGQLIRAPQILTSGTSYTTPSNCTAIYVECIGGGAGGASVTNIGAGGGGGSGAYIAKYFTVTPSTAYSYAIGASAASNTAGNDTTFGPVSAVTLTAGGGLVGSKTGTVATDVAIGGAGGSAATGNGDINTRGSSGMPGILLSNSNMVGGAGGSSVLGSGGNGRSASTGAGIAGTNGGGGGGGMATTATNAAGGAGGAGFIRIWEYT